MSWTQWSILVTPLWSSRKLCVNIGVQSCRMKPAKSSNDRLEFIPGEQSPSTACKELDVLATWPRQSSHPGWVCTVWLSSDFQAWFLSLQVCSSSRCDVPSGAMPVDTLTNHLEGPPKVARMDLVLPHKVLGVNWRSFPPLHWVFFLSSFNSSSFFITALI